MKSQRKHFVQNWVKAGLALVCFAVLGFGNFAHAVDAAVQPPVEAFFRDADVVDALLSPNGKRLAMTTSRGGTRIGLFVLDLADGHSVKSVARFINADVVNVRWLDEERLLFSAVDYSEGSGSANGAPGLFVVSANGEGLRSLINRKSARVVIAEVSRKALDWNHVLIKVPNSVSGRENDEVLIGKLIESGDGGSPTVVPLWLNVKTGRTRNPGFNAPRDAISWMFDSRGEPRVVMTRDGKKLVAYWRGPGKSEWQKLVEGDLLSLPFTPHTVDDAGNLYVTRKEGTEGYLSLVRYNFETMAPEGQALVTTQGFDFMGRLILERGTGVAEGVRVNTDAETTVWFDPAMKSVQASIDATIPGRINSLSCRKCGDPDAVVLVRSYSDREPGRLLLYRPQPKEGQTQWQAIATVRSDIDPRAMGRMDFQRIQARDGRDLPVWITYPANAVPGKPSPAVVLVHGGPWVRGSSWGWRAMPQFLASRGYVVIEPEFRGSKGYGDAHFKAGWKQWGQSMQDDVTDALAWAQKQGIASDKACIAGASYGGYSTLMGLVRNPELYRCGVAWLAVSDLQLILNGNWWVRDDTSEITREHVLPEMVGSAEKEADMIAKNSPVLLAVHIKAPLLLAFGEADRRVPLAHGNRLREALKKEGREPEWVSYPGEGHGWAMLETRLDFARRVEQFLAKHLVPDPIQASADALKVK